MYKHETITDGVYAIDEDGIVTIYLVCGKNKAALIDTGCGSESLRAYAENLYSGDIAVLHTHTHGDHTGCDHEFSEIYVHEDDAPALACCGIDSGSVSFLREGDTVDLGDRILTVYETPGHTKGSLVFGDEKNGLLFTGDNISDEPVWLTVPDSDFDDYLASMKRLAAMAPRYSMLLGCHGQPDQTKEQIDNLIECVNEYRAGKLQEEDFLTWGEIHKICSTGKASILIE